MVSNFISTYNLLNGPRLHSRAAQAEIARLGKEIVDARHADVGLVLGAKTGHAAILYQELGRVETFTTSNSLTASRLDVTQAALTEVREGAEKILATLVGLPTNELGAGTVHGEAMRALKALTDNLNSAYAGQQLFSGIKTDTAPMDFAGGSAQVQGAFTAFQAQYQTLYWDALSKPGTPTVNEIVPEAMDIFFNRRDPDELEQELRTAAGLHGADPNTPEIDALKALAQDVQTSNTDFGTTLEASWGTVWSSASDSNLSSRISATETIDSSVSANAPVFRQLTKAYAALGALPSSGMNEGAFKEAIDYAIAQLGEAVNGLTLMQADIGSTQARVSVVTEEFATQKSLLQRNLVDLEGVDPVEAKVSLDAVELQLSLSYALTARLQKLNLLNYIA